MSAATPVPPFGNHLPVRIRFGEGVAGVGATELRRSELAGGDVEDQAGGVTDLGDGLDHGLFWRVKRARILNKSAV